MKDCSTFVLETIYNINGNINYSDEIMKKTILVVVTIGFLLTGWAGTWLDGNFGKVLGGNNNSDDSEYKYMNYEQNNGTRNSNLQNHLPEPVQITDDNTHQGDPDIYENKIVWNDFSYIYMYDLGSDGKYGTEDDGEEILISSGYYPAIYENKIIWNSCKHIYMYDLGPDKKHGTEDDSGLIRITEGSNPDIYENIIVYEKDDNIYIYGLGSDGIFGTEDDGGEIQITDDLARQNSPATYGNKIVWSDYRNSNYDIYMYDLGPDGIFGTEDDGGEVQITDEPESQQVPATYGNKIVWSDWRNGGDIYMYDLGPDGEYGTQDDFGEVQITDELADQYGAYIYENKILWMDDRNGNREIYMYDLGDDGIHGTGDDGGEVQITDELADQVYPVTYGNKIVWTDYRNDPGDYTNADIYMINLSGEPKNNPPVLENILDTLYANAGEPFYFNINGTDPDNDTLTYSENTSLFEINEKTGEVNWTPKEEDIGTYKVKFSVDDRWGGIDEKEVTLEVKDKLQENRPPVIEYIPDTLHAQVEKSFYLDVNATDLDGDTLTYSEDSLFFEIDEKSGEIYWTPKKEDVGIYYVNISVSDGNDGWGYTEFTLHVRNINDPPFLYDGNFTPSKGNTSTNFTFSIKYKDIDGDEPGNISVVINEYWYTMISNDSMHFDFIRGVRYNFTLNLTEGIHQYYYSVSDGKTIVRFPQNGYLITPDIQPILDNNIEIDYDKDSDNDTYNNTYENASGSDPYDSLSTPFDFDADGWNDTIETQVGTDPRDKLSLPPDLDGDGIPDSIDPDRDGDKVANVDDPYPDDGNRWEKEDKVEQSESAIIVWVGIVIIVSIIAVAGVILYLSKKRKGKEVEQSSEDDFGRVEKGEMEENE